MKGSMKYLFATGLALTLVSASGQQLSQYSQYLQNEYVVNPAAVGVKDWTDISLSMRRQWVGLADAPQTYYLGVSHCFGGKAALPRYNPGLRISSPVPVPEPKVKHGLGGIAAVDKYGAFQRTSFNMAYAFHYSFHKQFKLSAGAGIGMAQLSLDQDMIDFGDNVSDATYNAFISNSANSLYLDLNMGIRIYGEHYFLGYANNQLIGDKVTFGDALGREIQDMHHFISAGYRYPVNDDLVLIPNMMFKLIAPAPLSIDVNLRAEFLQRFWGGLSYRHEDAVVVMAGLNHQMFRVGYSYDLTFSDMRRVSAGSHEIVLGLMLGKEKKPKTEASSI